MINNIYKIGGRLIGILILGFGTILPTNAQSEEIMEQVEPGFFETLMSMDPLLLTVLILIATVMVLLLITLTLMVNTVSYMQRAIEKQKAPAGEFVEPPTLWERMKEKLITGKLYAEKEERTSMMLDHDYDGIREMDYGMPPWLTAIFAGTIIFAIAYLVQLWGIGNIQDQITEYENDVKQAEIAIAEWRDKQSNLIDETSVEFINDELVLAQGKEIYLKECKACHQEDGGGSVGPNLTDNYWIHGGSISDIFSTIKYGVPEKGMISWQTKLNPGEMQSVASYIKTLVGTTPANPKDPQGDLYESEGTNNSNSEEINDDDAMSDTLNLSDTSEM